MLAILAPGQGSQAPGMLAPWLELAGVAEQVAAFSELAGLDLARLGTTADADEIRDSAVTQPLIVAMGLITASQLTLGRMSEERSERQGAKPAAMGSKVLLAGHSVGEVTVAAIAGTLTPAQAISFAARRGAEMAAACALTPTSMVAVIGGEADEVLAAILDAGLTPANRNGSGQIVAAGSVEAIAAFTANPPPLARIRPLQVAGAFHTDYMSPAEQNLRAVAAQLSPADPSQTLLSNVDGAVVDDGPTVLARLVGQVTRPVRWDLCLDTMRAMGVTGVVELAPAGTLSGIARRELPGAQRVAVKSPADLESARRLLAEESFEELAEESPAEAAPQPDPQAATSPSGPAAAQPATTGMS